MSILVNWQIKERLEKDLGISPYDECNLMPASYNLCLAGSFIYGGRNYSRNYENKNDGERMLIRPYEFMLGSTIEKITLPDNLVGQISGRSSYARMGLFIHTCAGYVDPGFSGEVTFELFNCSDYPIIIDIGEPIAQITFIECETANPSYSEIGNYNGQKGATISKLLRNQDEKFIN